MTTFPRSPGLVKGGIVLIDPDTLVAKRIFMNQMGLNASPERLYGAVSGTFTESCFGYDFSRVPAHSDVAQQTLPLLRTKTMVQRFPKNGAAGYAPCPACTDEEPTPISAPAEPTAEIAPSTPEVAPTLAEPEEESAAPEETTAPALLVEDSATELAPGQMRKSEFLAQLRTEVNRTAEAAMAGTGRTTRDCPYLNYWFGYYSRQDSAHIERAIHKYAPETASVTSAREYIPIIAGRVRQAVKTWTRTGEITGVPEGVPTTLPGESPARSGGGAATLTGPVMFKAREGGVRMNNNPEAVQEQFGHGLPLDSILRSRMESGFGMDFSHVRVHTDAIAAGLTNTFNARAFTVGNHIAFGSGEYQPGTLFGDALLAHELAHVSQQEPGEVWNQPSFSESATHDPFEEEADRNAVRVILSLMQIGKSAFKTTMQKSSTGLKSGLRLQRCPCPNEWKDVFCIHNGTTHVNQVEADLNELNRTSQGSGLFRELENARRRSYRIFNRSACNFFPVKIHYNSSGCNISNDCPGEDSKWTKVPNYVYLFHEAVHVYLYEVLGKGTDLERDCMTIGLGKYFKDIKYNENKLRCELGLPIRPCYGKECEGFSKPQCE